MDTDNFFVDGKSAEKGHRAIKKIKLAEDIKNWGQDHVEDLGVKITSSYFEGDKLVIEYKKKSPMTEKEKLEKEAFEDFVDWLLNAFLMVGLWVWFVWRLTILFSGVNNGNEM